MQRDNLTAEVTLEEQIREYVAAGARASADLYQQQANVAAARLRVIQAQNAVELSNVDLLRTLQLDASQTYDFQVPPVETIYRDDSTSLQDMVTRALSGRTDLQAEEARVRAMEQGVHVASSGYWPTLSLAAGYGSSYTNALPESPHDQLDAYRNGSVSLNISVPLFDSGHGLKVIAGRAHSWGRFLAQYGRLAHLPAARPHWLGLRSLIARVVALEPLHRIEVRVPDDLEVHVDEDQLEQALINLARNAVEAQEGSDGRVIITAHGHSGALVITVTDEGLGVANPDNLFVPFFTTKPGGSGVGLVLSRQIAEAHGGTLSLENRRDAQGAIAKLEIPGAVRVSSPGSIQ